MRQRRREWQGSVLFGVAAAALLALRLATAGTGGGELPVVPAGLPPLPVPAGNPLTPAKVALGERLFFDPGLSADRTVSCASCHRPDRYFADEKPLSGGVGGQLGDRNTVSVLNAAYASPLLWDGRSPSLEDQVEYPTTHPKEMGTTPEKVVESLAADPSYRPLFTRAFGDPAVTWERVTQALASFERTLLTGNSPFDRSMAGEAGALTEPARRGFEVFRTAGCMDCHTYSRENPFFSDFAFHNTGVGWWDAPDFGRFTISKARKDKGAFRTPSLRNVAGTAPYMHDGRLATLADVVDFYARGGEKNPFLDKKMKPLELTEGEKADLIAFLESLTGEVTYRPAAAARSGSSARSPR